jgi:hypothetical protein
VEVALMFYEIGRTFSKTGRTFLMNWSENIEKIEIVTRLVYWGQEKLFEEKKPEVKNLVALSLSVNYSVKAVI